MAEASVRDLTTYVLKPDADGVLRLQQTTPEGNPTSNAPRINFNVGADGTATIGLTSLPRDRIFNSENEWDVLEFAGWAVALILILLIGLVVTIRLFRGQINLTEVVSEPDGKASLSRFQALLFTFVFLISFMLVVGNTGTFPEDIPYPVLAILAGSLGTYLISKYITQGHTAVAAGVLDKVLWLSPAGTVQFTPTSGAATILKAAYARGAVSDSVLVRLTPRVRPAPEANDFTVVGVVVGPNKLRLTPTVPGDAGLQVHVRWVGSDGKLQTMNIDREVTIDTAADVIGEVALAAFGPRAGGPVAVQIARAN